MKKTRKTVLKFIALVFALLTITGCTANFCSVNDQAHMLYMYDSGLKYDDDGNVVYETKVTGEGENAVEVKTLQFANPEITKQIAKIGESFDVPSVEFWKAIDTKVLALATAEWEKNGSKTEEDKLKTYGYLKFAGTTINKKGKEVDTLWANWDKMIAEIKTEIDLKHVPGKDFINQYKMVLQNYVTTNRICVTPADGYYGPNEDIYIEGKTWGDAFDNGFIEGLLVYPIAWLAHTFTNLFLGAGVSSGWAQFLAILLMTFIIRGLLILFTFKSTMDQQKMTALQPELAKLQEKYPNSNTNQYEKQLLAQAQMALYKKHKINPMSQILTLIVQFPIFIAVWGALSGSSILTSGDIFGMSLGKSISSAITTWSFDGAWWTALVLFILMSASQIISSQLSRWMQAKETKKVSKMGKNPAAAAQNKQMKMMSWFMTAMIVVMGFSLPSGMGIYWLIGALISMAQTIITQTIMKRKKK